ncbi:MAG TPA: RT0821/Lpp0805 family surface protein [Ramlibacter sp.]|uniref:RT0821/Lpp0805 family surface protein n=1 Tax=Ramlibacter sp. TaxID=1917967 RepID=UPI002D7E3D55|nr:RT0821/Lpp0805 family surface protein [Ramlibacter sp.]HET8745733.1 RT0821/Lpp0805 family surface protein [Ramlibacter sp.]
MKTFVVIALTAALLAGCGTSSEIPREQAGTVIGAVAGGLLGSQIGGGDGRVAATIVGAIAGGAIGQSIGRSMDQTDRLRTAQVLESNPTGTRTHWRNPDTGAEYTVVPTRTYASAQGPCREYTMDAVIGGRLQKVYGTACRQPDGSWRAQP